MRKAILMAIMVMGLTAMGESVPRLVAHRGGSLEQDENTLAALKNSFEKGVRGFEIDVRLTKDRRVVVLHDDLLARTTDGQGRIEEMTAAEIAPVRTKKTAQPLPYLEEIFDFLKGKEGAFIQVEIKCKDYTDEKLSELCVLMTTLVKERIEPSKVIFISFDKRALQKMKELNLAQQTCLVASDVDAKVIQTAKEIGAEHVSVQLDSACRKFVKDAHKAGLKVTTWTVRKPEDARLAMLLGADFVASDVPAQQLEEKTAVP